MVAKTTKSQAKPSAWIVSPKDKGRKSIKKGKVFLNNGDEFEIELFNPLTECVLAEIKLNGQSITKTGLVLKPGQRFYLDCFIDDKKKFIFNTYEVETGVESMDAIKNNGLLEVFFYKEDVITIDNWKNKFNNIIIEKWYPTWYPNWYPGWYTTPYYTTLNNTCGFGTCTTGSTYNTFTGTLTNGISNANTFGSLTSYASSDSVNAVFNNSGVDGNMSINSSMETGRVEKGSSSSQKFTTIDMEFESNYISSTIIEILPESVKPIETSELGINEMTGELIMVKTKDVRKGDEIIELIKKLSELHTTGILTDDEFSNKKIELLSKI